MNFSSSKKLLHHGRKSTHRQKTFEKSCRYGKEAGVGFIYVKNLIFLLIMLTYTRLSVKNGFCTNGILFKRFASSSKPGVNEKKSDEGL